MKKIVMMGWIALMLAVGAAGCVEEPIASVEESPALAEEAMILEDSQSSQSSQDPHASAEGARLAAQHRAARVAAQELGKPMEVLALEERTSSASGQLKDEALAAAGVRCGDWSTWETVDSYCEWATMCFWRDATYLVRERSRGCYAPGNAFVDWDYTTVRGGCGC